MEENNNADQPPEVQELTDVQHTATAQVIILNDNFDMPQLGSQRRIWLHLPKNYDGGERNYPVIYMQDGQNLFDAATASYAEWAIDEYMDTLPDEGQCIIVGIDHAGDARLTEYNPFDSEHGEGKGHAYADFLVQTLKPFIDQNYRTCTDAKHTGVAGSSMGGLIAMFTALKYPEIFGQAGILSPAFWIATKIYEYAEQSDLPSDSRFYFVCGDAESETMVGDVEGMATIIRNKGFSAENVPVIIREGAGHNEQQWQEDFPDFYQWFNNAFMD